MRASGSTPLTVDVVSDVVCPWCFIGKRRLDRALKEVSMPVAVRWRPYQLDPTIAPGGKPRREYMEAKFGSAERIHGIHARLESEGHAEGIPFSFDRIEISPNTLDAHRLIRWAADSGVQDAIVEALFRAYFVDGLDIGHADVLADIAEGAGMDRNEAQARLASEEDRAAVSGEVQALRGAGVTGVPTFIIAGRYALVGAQPAEAIAEALRAVLERSNGGLQAEPA